MPLLLFLPQALIRSGKHDCVLVVAADAVTEFVFSGFSSLMALDPDKAKPFDKNRAGLSWEKGGRFHLLMRPKKELKKKTGRSWVKWLVGLWQGTLII